MLNNPNTMRQIPTRSDLLNNAPSPNSLGLTLSDLKACKDAIRKGSKSFFAASMLLPSRQRFAARALYAFCRNSDDLVDESDNNEFATFRLRQRLEAVYKGTPEDIACDRAFAAIVSAYEIPKEIPLALIEGFEWDISGREFKTFEDTLDYAARVASTVGVMMTLLMERRDRDVLARAAELGLAMQLTNIARDIGEDARNGRVYIPTQWLNELEIDRSEFLKNPAHDGRTRQLVERLLKEADRFYESAVTGVRGLPANCRHSIVSAANIYRSIGKSIANNGYNSIDFRAHTTGIQKIGLSMSALLATPFVSQLAKAAPHSSIVFLVDIAGRENLALEASPVDRFLGILAKQHNQQIEQTLQARKSWKGKRSSQLQRREFGRA